MSISIPRKDANNSDIAGIGNVYAEFYTLEEAKETRRVNILNLFSNFLEENMIEERLRLFISLKRNIQGETCFYRRKKKFSYN